MTKQEALQAMKDGKKVFHEYYTSDEYLWMNENGHIFTEENYDMGTERSEFWVFIQKWADGWFLYER